MMVVMIPVVVELRILQLDPKSSHLKRLSVGDVADTPVIGWPAAPRTEYSDAMNMII